MTIAADKIQFTDANIKEVPAEAGVYALFEGETIIYFGRAQGGDVTIRSRLADHKAGREGPCTKNATVFKVEITSSAVTREKELLEEYKNAHGSLPRCNQKVA
ncbi:MAG: hypothetical protein V3T84_02800 [Phycisphaerales bacterium]